jgi:hypothetical protein
MALGAVFIFLREFVPWVCCAYRKTSGISAIKCLIFIPSLLYRSKIYRFFSTKNR